MPAAGAGCAWNCSRSDKAFGFYWQIYQGLLGLYRSLVYGLGVDRLGFFWSGRLRFARLVEGLWLGDLIGLGEL